MNEDVNCIEAKIFYFKDGEPTGDVEHERKLAIDIIDVLKRENDELTANNYFLRANTAYMLKDYSDWLFEHGYTDDDIWAEKPEAQERYMSEKLEGK